MDFARINPSRDADTPATWPVEYEGEVLYWKDKEPIEIDILGLDGVAGKKAQAKMVKMAARKVKNPNRQLGQMSEKEIEAFLAGQERAKAHMFAELTTGWRNIYYLEDEDMHDPNAVPTPMEFSKENAIKLCTTRPWIVEGLDAFLGLRDNFAKEVGKS